ncbi:hypothetical protein L1856_35610 [Streptomyces sp. Tue 6430]|nr:hypothetical protein [Streptomyces sp. Tue 6430]
MSVEPLVHNPKNGVTAGVWRVRAGGRSAVLKVLTRRKAAEGRWAASDDPRHWNHWRREAHVYASGLAQTWQPYGIRAPGLLECVERPDGTWRCGSRTSRASPPPPGRSSDTWSRPAGSARPREPSA